ncbi:MAG TPA: PSD1 and planctomycete cytochrome C domain-containing protein [Blastocatellia bacterium]|nr:PSD1 and planctomycete cytochrome C domain-containing protein [Blastocatellia bacterium]
MSTRISFALKATAVIVVASSIWFCSQHSAQTASSQQPAFSAEGLEFFEKKIRPVLADNCYACHSATAKKPAGGLLLDSREAMLKGGASGQPSIVPGNVEASLLIKAIRHTDAKLQMPMGVKLPDQVIRDFEAWVKMGAPDPRNAAAATTYISPYDFNEAKKFWSFQPVKDSPLPNVNNQAWIKNPIDNFILAKLEEKKLKPVGDADKLTLIRRATFDLTGLPPTPEEIDAFVKDTAPNAFEKVLDRLLASQAYGEKWGRHWLDLVRYADTAGDNSDYPVPAAWRYRNYVINAFHQDKPYDQFIREQLAGDILAKFRFPSVNGKLPEEEEDEAEVPGAKKQGANTMSKERQEKIIATGYLAMSRRFGSRNREMNLTIDDTIDNLGKTFLGLSTNCARCHDHKFDPIPQRDYYALYGIFNSIRYSFPGAEIYPHPAEMVALVTGKPAEDFYKQQKELSETDDLIEQFKTEAGVAARNKRMKDAAAATNDAQPKANNESGAQASDAKTAAPITETLLSADYDRDTNNSKTANASKRMPDEVSAHQARIKARIAELHNRYLNAPKAYAVFESLPANARIHRKGDPKNLGDEVPRGFLTILGGQQIPKDHKGSGREFLANWIADKNNPLTARVLVNRIWHWHFGKGIVPTTNDFGSRGKAPTHPELLDYLAARFIEGGWSIKKLHKLMMLSHAYQLASSDNAANAAIDVSNEYLWRFQRRRLDAEEVRDAVLAVSGQLDRTMGEGHPFPSETTWRFSQHVQYFGVYDTNRRSVYVMQQRLKKHPFFEVFDGADTNMVVGERPLSTTPIQALFLMNNPLMHEQADAFAVRVGMAFDTLPERVNYAYRLAFGRAAKPDEIKDAQEYLQQVKPQLTMTAADRVNRAAWASYLRVVLSSNEFLYVD